MHHTTARTNPHRRPIPGGGFTLVELIVVIIIVGIMAAVSIPRLASLGVTRQRYAARQLFKDLTFARERAISTGKAVYVVFAPGSETYTILAEDPANPGRANATIIADPATRGSFIRSFGSGESWGVDMVSAVFDGANEIGFDWNGRPLNSTQTPLAATGTVTMSGGNLIQVQPVGGLVTCTIP